MLLGTSGSSVMVRGLSNRNRGEDNNPRPQHKAVNRALAQSEARMLHWLVTAWAEMPSTSEHDTPLARVVEWHFGP